MHATPRRKRQTNLLQKTKNFIVWVSEKEVSLEFEDVIANGCCSEYKELTVWHS
jgi:hypothetical protein